MNEQIRRVPVWSGRLRFAHWTMAGATLWLIATGWLIGHSPAVATVASELHYLGAGILLFALLLRLFLGLFGNGAERFDQLLPTASEFDAVRASLLFYLSLGRSRLPNWYAHNPLWKLLYLGLFVLLTLLALSGWLMPEQPLLWRFYLPQVHTTLATLVTVVTVAHLYSVALQDYRGDNADVSAMINGHRYFAIDRERPTGTEAPPVAVRLDDLVPPGRSKRHD
ncbi:MAG: cytochrome b/b6 domain-containing protein [Gammaproteobacteria bacterium]|nr:cytochrome b/b6 domain-containing protein [Gammaproteobacteria bacterium]